MTGNQEVANIEVPPHSPNEEGEPEDLARARSLQLGGGFPLGQSLGKYTRFLSEVRQELQKVTWPTRKQVLIETAVVIAVCVFFLVMILLLDRMFGYAFGLLLFGRTP